MGLGSKISGIILSGVPARVDAVSHYGFVGVTNLVRLFTGQTAKGGFVQKMIDGLVHKDWRDKVPKPQLTKADWLTADESVRKSFAQHPECGQDFTLGYWMGIHDVNWKLKTDD